MKYALKLSLIASTTLFLILSGSSFAADDAGKKLYNEKICQTCHGDDGNTPSNPAYPKIAGQSEIYVLQQLKDFKNGKRSNAQAAVMKAMLATVTEENMEVLAAYISSLPAK